MSFVQSLKALADVRRLKILQMLLNSDLCVGALANHLGVSKPAVSQHLQILRKAGLVKGEKRGYWTHYAVDKQALIRIAEDLRQMAGEDKRRESPCWRIQAPVHQKNSEEVEMCQDRCRQPENLKDKPENCTAEQIKKCHGDSREHPCRKGDCVSESRDIEQPLRP